MHKEDFIAFLAETSSSASKKLTKKSATEMIEIFSEGVAEALAQKKSVKLTGFGKFYSFDCKERIGTNPKTGEKMKIPAYTQPGFKAGKRLKDAAKQS